MPLLLSSCILLRQNGFARAGKVAGSALDSNVRVHL
jgi:hypothetical protein